MTEFESIYRSYFKDVYSYIRRLSRDEHVAEEITSETFLRAMGSIGRFRGECDVRVWLCQIAKNCYYSYLKKAGRTESLEDPALPEVPVQGESVEEQLVGHDEAERVRRVLHGIPEPYKEVFLWRVFAELSFRQIGQIFGKSENWACVTYHRARNMIRERSEAEDHEQGM